jgi:hypothetical protein
MIAKERVVSRVDEEGRRVILESSLPGQSQGARHGMGHGAGHGMSQGFGYNSGQGAGHDASHGLRHGPDHGAGHDLRHDRAMIELLQGQLQQARDSERELRLLLAQAVKTNQLLAEPRMLPPAPDTGPEPPGTHKVGGRTRWWNLFWRGARAGSVAECRLHRKCCSSSPRC